MQNIGTKNCINNMNDAHIYTACIIFIVFKQ